MRRFCLFLLLLLLLSAACNSPSPTLRDLRTAFATPEFIPSGDGWAEARRRRLLKQFLLTSKVVITEKQELLRAGDANNKYRRVTLSVREVNPPDETATPIEVSLSLIPPRIEAEKQAFADSQRKCDIILFNTLANLSKALSRHNEVRFVMTETCLKDGLTPRLQE